MLVVPWMLIDDAIRPNYAPHAMASGERGSSDAFVAQPLSSPQKMAKVSREARRSGRRSGVVAEGRGLWGVVPRRAVSWFC